ncbi:MAG TPA: hypothetical protein VFU65_21890 [Actinocrinis sp.]|nr:hypothetical protein [Actinocrinis sp.]
MFRPCFRRLGRSLLLPAAMAALTAATVASCSSSAPGGGAQSTQNVGLPLAPIHVASIPTIADSASLAFPIDAYLITQQQHAEMDNATVILAGRCMQRFGFNYSPISKNAKADQTTETNAPRRYGIANAAQVSVLGYHPPTADVSAVRASANTLDAAGIRVLTGGASPAQAASATATAGNAGSYNGAQIPAGGCLGEARRQLTGHGGAVNDSPIAQAIDGDSLSRSQQEPQVVAVFKQWSQCMAAKGYDYATPYDAGNDHRWATAAPTAVEIQAATADVACKQKTNLIGVWYAVDRALQTSMINAQQQQLDAVKDGIAQEMKATAQVVGAAN